MVSGVEISDVTKMALPPSAGVMVPHGAEDVTAPAFHAEAIQMSW